MDPNENVERADELRQLVFHVSSFLEEPNDNDMRAMQMSDQAFRDQQWKCKHSAEYVRLAGVTARDLEVARNTCLALDDTYTEPTGGKGGFGVDVPIRDDHYLPQALHAARGKGSTQRAHDTKILHVLQIILVIIVLLFLFTSS